MTDYTTDCYFQIRGTPAEIALLEMTINAVDTLYEEFPIIGHVVPPADAIREAFGEPQCQPDDDDPLKDWAAVLAGFDDKEDLQLDINALKTNDESSLILYDGGGHANLDALCWIVQHCLKESLPVGFEVSYQSSPRHIDGFGGAWYVIGKDQILSGCTNEAMIEGFNALTEQHESVSP